MYRHSEFSGTSNSPGRAQRHQNKNASWKVRSSSHDLTPQYSSRQTMGARNLGDEQAPKEFPSSKTGYLTKRSIGSIDALANWRERFFVLADGNLCYYKVGGGFFSKKKEEEQDLAHLKGQLELTGESVVKKSNIDSKTNCFEINTGDKRMFAQANTAKECEDWIKSIQTHINALEKRRVSPGRAALNQPKPTPEQFEASMFASSAANLATTRTFDKDYTRPSLLESHDIVRGAEASTDPKDIVIKQLLEENRQMREQLILKDQSTCTWLDIY
jgi:hypothetical protein